MKGKEGGTMKDGGYHEGEGGGYHEGEGGGYHEGVGERRRSHKVSFLTSSESSKLFLLLPLRINYLTCIRGVDAVSDR